MKTEFTVETNGVIKTEDSVCLLERVETLDELQESSKRVTSIYDTFMAYKSRERFVRGAFVFTGIFIGVLGDEALKTMVPKESAALASIFFALASFGVAWSLGLYSVCDLYGLCKKNEN